MSACENHPEREGLLTVSLPSIGIMRHMCAECRTAFDKAMVEHAQHPHGRRDWHIENEPFWGWNGENNAYTNDNARYERMRDQHTIDRSRE